MAAQPVLSHGGADHHHGRGCLESPKVSNRHGGRGAPLAKPNPRISTFPPFLTCRRRESGERWKGKELKRKFPFLLGLSLPLCTTAGGRLAGLCAQVDVFISRRNPFSEWRKSFGRRRRREFVQGLRGTEQQSLQQALGTRGCFIRGCP